MAVCDPDEWKVMYLSTYIVWTPGDFEHLDFVEEINTQWRSSSRWDHKAVGETEYKQVISISKLYENPVVRVKHGMMAAHRRDTTPSSFWVQESSIKQLTRIPKMLSWNWMSLLWILDLYKCAGIVRSFQPTFQ